MTVNKGVPIKLYLYQQAVHRVPSAGLTAMSSSGFSVSRLPQGEAPCSHGPWRPLEIWAALTSLVRRGAHRMRGRAHATGTDTRTHIPRGCLHIPARGPVSTRLITVGAGPAG